DIHVLVVGVDALGVSGTVLHGGNALGTVSPVVRGGPLIGRDDLDTPDGFGILLHRLDDDGVLVGIVALALPVHIVADALHAALGDDLGHHVLDLLVIHADGQADVHNGFAVVGHHVGAGA